MELVNIFVWLRRLWAVLALLSGLVMVAIAASTWPGLEHGTNMPVTSFSARLSLIGGALGILYAGRLVVKRQDKLSHTVGISRGARWASTADIALFPLTAVVAYTIHSLCVVQIVQSWHCPWGNFQAIGLLGGGLGSFIIAGIIVLLLHGITRTACWIAEGLLA